MGSNVSLASALNPGGTNAVTVAASNFSGTDADGGAISQIKITNFPKASLETCDLTKKMATTGSVF